jgi:hypothetical protein
VAPGTAFRLEAGDRVRPHSHIGAVQHYVLEGEYGDVPEISTTVGATVLMIYDPVA